MGSCTTAGAHEDLYQLPRPVCIHAPWTVVAAGQITRLQKQSRSREGVNHEQEVWKILFIWTGYKIQTLGTLITSIHHSGSVIDILQWVTLCTQPNCPPTRIQQWQVAVTGQQFKLPWADIGHSWPTQANYGEHQPEDLLCTGRAETRR